jgi:DNA-directed RNA polymerase specialized sigma54-like protein
MADPAGEKSLAIARRIAKKYRNALRWPSSR